MPLAFLQLGLECASKYAGKLRTGWLSELSEALRRVLGLVQVSEDRGRVRVRHLAMPRYDDIKSLLAAASLVMYSRHALDRAKLAVSRGVVEASLGELREVAESWLRGPLLGVAMHEIRAFEKAHARRSAPDALPLLIGENPGFEVAERGTERVDRQHSPDYGRNEKAWGMGPGA